MPLGTDVGFGPSDIVLDGKSTLSTEIGTAAPTFGPLFSDTVFHLSCC